MNPTIEKYPRPGVKPQKRVNAADLARLLGVDPGTIRSWREKGMPVEGDAYSVTDAVLWWADRNEVFPPRRAAGEVDPNDKEALECEKLRIENQRRELKLENERGRLVMREHMMAEVETMFHRVRSRLEAVPDELASSLPPELRSDYLADARHKMGLVLKEMEAWGDS